MPGPSRRAVLISGLGLFVAGGALGYEFIQDGTLPGKYALARLEGACGSAPPPPPRGQLPDRRAVSFYSAYRHRDVQMVTLIPAGVSGASDLRLVLALHGSGGDAAAMADQVAPAMAAARLRQLAVICVDGGDSYWHKRADGDDPAGMVLHEVLPRAQASGLETSRIGIAGESMGGYGALLLAERLAAAASAVQTPAVAAVAALSPAIFASYADALAANHRSFDSPGDFSRNNVFGGAAALGDVPAWIACGADDPFEPETLALRARLAGLTGKAVPGGILAGCHDDAFWARNMPAALEFIAAKGDFPQ